MSSCGLAVTPDNLSEWLTLGKQLAKQLGVDHSAMDDIQRLRIYHYYLPVYFWCRSQVAAHKAAGATTALVLGISAPQGCGKTTIVEQLQQLFEWTGGRAASVSIDDFYLAHRDQIALRESHPDNRLLAMRGNAGTHDLRLGRETVEALRALMQPGASMQVPRYNKSAYEGQGDRAPKETWPKVTGPLDIVLFEGWMSGFAARPAEDNQQLAKIDPGLVKVNELLAEYAGMWDALVDAWLVVRIGDPQWVFQWRLQAEERMRATGRPGMSDDQIADFVSRFQPAYQAYLGGLYAQGPTTSRPGKTLVVEVDQNRSPLSQQPPRPSSFA
mmetsp:Transcript_33837/g.100752  ORF Transcript_33837/g.100752 Transcript_33837/m.100752 type:complete len:328 (-) Transcript_33837:340-1323(-)